MRQPCAASPSARLADVVDLPTPPLPDATAMMNRMRSTAAIAPRRGAAVAGPWS